MADYGDGPDLVRELNIAARTARPRGGRRVQGADPSKPRFVAGATRPDEQDGRRSRRDVNDPGTRDVTFDQLRRRLSRAGRRP
jgi:hypothetical protein